LAKFLIAASVNLNKGEPTICRQTTNFVDQSSKNIKKVHWSR